MFEDGNLESDSEAEKWVLDVARERESEGKRHSREVFAMRWRSMCPLYGYINHKVHPSNAVRFG